MGSPSTASTAKGFGDAPPRTAIQQGGGRGRGGGGRSTMQNLPPQVFRKMTLSSTGFSEQTNINFRSLVEKHGGEFTTHFNVHVTALIASAVDTEKYRGAVKFGTPIVTRAWLDASIAHGKAADFASYLLPPLYELKVTSTGFMPGKRRKEGGREEKG
ncbi:brct domain-containing protein [Nannochloropsis oceanica]